MTMSSSIHIYIIPCISRSYTFQFQGIVWRFVLRILSIEGIVIHVCICIQWTVSLLAYTSPQLHGRLQDSPWARITDWRCFYKTLLFPIYCRCQCEILPDVLELLGGLLPLIFSKLRNYFTNDKERNFVVTKNYVNFKIQLWFIATWTPRMEKLFAPSKFTEKILYKNYVHPRNSI